MHFYILSVFLHISEPPNRCGTENYAKRKLDFSVSSYRGPIGESLTKMTSNNNQFDFYRAVYPLPGPHGGGSGGGPLRFGRPQGGR